MLIKHLMPIWKTYADGFVFMAHNSTDGTVEYLKSVKDEYNILEIIEINLKDEDSLIETDLRQELFDTARKYSDKLICLDADEYLDGSWTKNDLSEHLDQHKDVKFNLRWVQYTGKNTIRAEKKWINHYTDRIGSYTLAKPCQYKPKFNHAEHIPTPSGGIKQIKPEQLYIAHLQWLNKRYVAIKQYYWKISDYVQNHLHNVKILNSKSYDKSVNNFQWEETYFKDSLKVPVDIYDSRLESENYRVQYIIKNTAKYNIPNLGDWGFKIEGVPNDEPKKRFNIKKSIAIPVFSALIWYITSLIFN
jgi:hypothetical protein